MNDLNHDPVFIGPEVNDLFPKVSRFNEAYRLGVGHANRLIAFHLFTPPLFLIVL